MNNKLSIVIPCYNEQESILETASQIKSIVLDLIKKGKISEDSFIYFVDDGSKDKTWNHITNLHNESPILFKGLKLSRNFGHQNALLAGLFYVKDRADIFITIDADLQDDINIIEKFLDAHESGAEIVYGVRNKRDVDNIFKRKTAEFFYKLMILMGVNIVYNHADYRSISKRAVDNLFLFNEANLFLRGIFPLIGFQTEKVFYDRKERKSGKSKYGIFKMLSFAWEGITSFSVTPLRIFLYFSFLIFVLCIFLGIYFLYRHWSGHTVAGWTSLILIILFMGSLQCLGFGLLGEYIGKIYKETKSRPRFIKEEEIF